MWRFIFITSTLSTISTLILQNQLACYRYGVNRLFAYLHQKITVLYSELFGAVKSPDAQICKGSALMFFSQYKALVL